MKKSNLPLWNGWGGQIDDTIPHQDDMETHPRRLHTFSNSVLLVAGRWLLRIEEILVSIRVFKCFFINGKDNPTAQLLTLCFFIEQP